MFTAVAIDIGILARASEVVASSSRAVDRFLGGWRGRHSAITTCTVPEPEAAEARRLPVRVIDAA